MVKGINNSSKCFHEVYEKTEIDSIVQTINASIDTGGTATTANTNSINDIKEGNIATTIQSMSEEQTINDLGGTTGFKVFSVTDESAPTNTGMLLHIGKSDSDNTQIYIDGNNMYIRNYTNDEWSSWSIFNKNISITSGTSNPSGGNDGDIYFKYS